MLTKENENQILINKNGNIGYGISFLINPDAYFYKEHFDNINVFNSGNGIIDKVFKELHRHKECTNILFFNDNIPICFCSICCSSLKINDGGISELEPAIEFRYFGVDKNYQSKKLDDTNMTISSFMFMNCMDFAFTVAKNICGASYCTLNAVDEDRVRDFYKKHGFVEATENIQLSTADNLPDLIPAFLKIE